MNIDDVKNVTTQGEAREFAIQWQHWFTEQNMSWSEVNEWEQVFRDLAYKFDLISEFVENGIIGEPETELLTDEQIERQDFVDNTIHRMIGEVLGKHSEVCGTLEKKDLTIISDDQGKINWLVDTVQSYSISGWNPLDFTNEEDTYEDEYEDEGEE